MAEKRSEQKVSLTLGVGDFELSVEASESFVKQDLQGCLEQISQARLFGLVKKNLNFTPSDAVVEKVCEPFDLSSNPKNEYSMNSMVKILFGASRVSVSKVIQTAFCWLSTAESKQTPSFEEVRECFLRADDYLTPSQIRNFTRDFAVMKKAGKIVELNGGRYKLEPVRLQGLDSRVADA